MIEYTLRLRKKNHNTNQAISTDSKVIKVSGKALANTINDLSHMFDIEVSNIENKSVISNAKIDTVSFNSDSISDARI